MQPTTAPVATTQRTTIVAQSPAGHQLLEALAAIQAEFQANAASATLPEGAIVLPAIATEGRTVRHFFIGGDRNLEIGDSAGNADVYTCRRVCPEGWRPAHHNPAHWTHHLERIDAHGLRWTACGGDYVMDDFGMLVEVAR